MLSATRLGTECSMDERRSSRRARILKSGWIAVSEKAPKLECAIRNISDSGACLQVSTTFGIPANFELVISGGERRLCDVVWRTDTRLGVAFRAAHAGS
jgi:PilZ domain